MFRVTSLSFVFAITSPFLAIAALPNPVMFVTQVPMPTEVNDRDVAVSFANVTTPFGSHLADPRYCGRGGALMMLYPDGSLSNLTALANYGVAINGAGAPSFQGSNAIAVRDPSVHWGGAKAVFSMVVGAPTGPSDTTQFFWQLYEITNFAKGQIPVITIVPNQPSTYNNVNPTYGTDGRIIFTSDRPRNGQAHLTQRDEYLDLPTVSGIWSLDAASGDLFMVEHSPSGSFNPFVDSFGRLIFTRWDHLARDSEAVTDRPPISANGDNWIQTSNGTFNFSDETNHAPTATELANQSETYPEPRPSDHTSLKGTNLNGNAFNSFLPWMINEDGSSEELLNHIGRHELFPNFLASFTDDIFNASTNPNGELVNFVASGRNSINNLMTIREDPANPGMYYGIDTTDIGTHTAGRIVTLKGPPSSNPAGVAPNNMPITYVTASLPAFIPGFPDLATGVDIYRNPLPMSDGTTLIAADAVAKGLDRNVGTATNPQSNYTPFRLRTLGGSSGSFAPTGSALTGAGFNANLQYYAGGQLVTYTGLMWEIEPVEVVSRNLPGTLSASIAGLEQNVFAEELVDIPTFQNYLKTNNLALVVSRNVTTRDAADKQQPYNLKVAWQIPNSSPASFTQTIGAPGKKLYQVAYMQFLQADMLRGVQPDGGPLLPGRRVLATPLHDAILENPPVPNIDPVNDPKGLVQLGTDGSFAVILPARRAVTWNLVDSKANSFHSQVKERYWVNFKPGEIRTCTSCHGVNQRDQANNLPPSNEPAALHTLLQYWQSNHPKGTLQLNAPGYSVLKNAGNATVTVTRSGGSTGPLSLVFATSNGTALASQDYTATSGTLTWIDGDASAKTISIPLLNNPTIAGPKTLSISLSNSTQLGSQQAALITITEPPFETWAFQKYGSLANTASIGGPGADGDHDSLPNLLEYSFNTDPAIPTASTPFIPFTEVDPVDHHTYLTLNYRRRKPPIDVTYHVETTTDFLLWSEAPTAVVQFPAVDDGNGISETVKARALPPLDQATHLFMRVRVTKP